MKPLTRGKRKYVPKDVCKHLEKIEVEKKETEKNEKNEDKK